MIRDSGGGMMAAAPAAASGVAGTAISTDQVNDANTGPLAIGTHSASRRVWATVQVAGEADQDSGFATSGGPTAARADFSTAYASIATELWEITGATGTSVAATWFGDTESVAAFRTTGLQPKTGGAIVVNRNTGSNTTSSAVAVVVPIGGAVFVHGKRYISFTSSGPTIAVDETEDAGPVAGCRGAWYNDTGIEQSFNITGTTTTTRSQKYILAVVMEPIP